MKIVGFTTALLVAVLSVQVFAQESTSQDFQEFCQAWEGRWVCDMALVTDSPGIGKKDEKFTAYADCKVAHDGNAMICKGYGGKGSNTWIVVYDAGNKQIRGLWVTSGGDVSHSILYKKGDKWIEKCRGSQADGTKTQVTFTVTISDSGKTHTWTGTSTIGGKEMDEKTNVWHRVNT
jgi:hypothetical protein